MQFSIFPSLLLLLTLFRLGLNVSTTRSILSKGDAGGVVDTFGTFVVGGNILVGLVVFFILIIIQFIVITKGAERVSEVAARFTLDAMPGKQMSIDADLNAGIISEHEARERREKVAVNRIFTAQWMEQVNLLKVMPLRVLLSYYKFIFGIIIGMYATRIAHRRSGNEIFDVNCWRWHCQSNPSTANLNCNRNCSNTGCIRRES